jgi:hypothetical protein
MKDFTIKNILLVYLLSATSAAYSQTVTELGFFAPLISTFEGKYFNNHLFITQQGLKVFDVSNPANPTMTSQASYPGSYAYQIEINGNYLYLGEGGSGYFSVYDITSINSPALTGSTAIPSSSFITGGDLLVTGSVAYMSGGDTLYTIDVSDPAAPALANSLQIVNTPFGSAGAMAIDGQFIFVLNSLNISVYDISNPLSPVLVNTIPLSHTYHTGLAVDSINHRLFSPWLSALQSDAGYDAFDITTASAPVYLFSDSTAFVGGEFGQTDYYNDVLIISKGGGMNVFDVSAAGHHFLTSFSGQNVANSVVSLEFRDSIFYNIKRGGFEILELNNAFPTGMKEVSTQSFSIYPNPASSATELKIEGTPDRTYEFEILALTGDVIFKKKDLIPGQQIRLTDLSPGIYIAKLSSDNLVQATKLVIE